jgi:drug/metabolite transporter (DMT)-like permease
MSEYTVSSYTSFSMAIIYGLLMLQPGNDLRVATQNFEFLDWLILFGLGITSSLMQICRTRSSQYEEPAKLSIVQYFQSVFQLIFDILFFNTAFSMQQILGIAIVMGASFLRCGYGINKTFFKKKVKPEGGNPNGSIPGKPNKMV